METQASAMHACIIDPELIWNGTETIENPPRQRTNLLELTLHSFVRWWSMHELGAGHCLARIGGYSY